MLRLDGVDILTGATSRLVRVERQAGVKRRVGVGGVAEVVSSRDAGLLVVYELTVMADQPERHDRALEVLIGWSDGLERSLEDGVGRCWQKARLTSVYTGDVDRCGTRYRGVFTLGFEAEGLVSHD